MNVTLLVFVLLYLVGTLALGAWAGTRVKNTSDFAVAGRSLPLIMVVTTSFATWFGAETVMGIPAKFAQGGLSEVVEDPFGASMCLVLVGLFFATKLYPMNLLTIGDYYRKRYGTTVEVLSSVMIIISYLGWVAAQITALGLVFSILSGGQIDAPVGMTIGTVLVLVYVMMGGMLAVAYTDFIQMIVLVIGLMYIAVSSANLAGGASNVISAAADRDMFSILPESTVQGWLFFVGAAITMMLGSIPQQDVFQRVMSAKSASTARNGAVIGGLLYLMFAFVPMFIVVSAMIVMPDQVAVMMPAEAESSAGGVAADAGDGMVLAEAGTDAAVATAESAGGDVVGGEASVGDPQYILPTLILDHMPLTAQILFFGALVSAIKSCSSATLLAPSTSFVENILRNFYPRMNDRQVLLAMRITILIFTCCVLTFAIATRGLSIYDMVSNAYKVTLVGSFVPLVFGLYWRRATTQGAILSIAAGIAVWLLVDMTTWETDFSGFLLMQYAGDASDAAAYPGYEVPGQLAGVLAALVGMFAGSLAPQWLTDRRERIDRLPGPDYAADPGA